MTILGSRLFYTIPPLSTGPHIEPTEGTPNFPNKVIAGRLPLCAVGRFFVLQVQWTLSKDTSLIRTLDQVPTSYKSVLFAP